MVASTPFMASHSAALPFRMEMPMFISSSDTSKSPSVPEKSRSLKLG